MRDHRFRPSGSRAIQDFSGRLESDVPIETDGCVLAATEDRLDRLGHLVLELNRWDKCISQRVLACGKELLWSGEGNHMSCRCPLAPWLLNTIDRRPHRASSRLGRRVWNTPVMLLETMNSVINAGEPPASGPVDGDPSDLTLLCLPAEDDSEQRICAWASMVSALLLLVGTFGFFRKPL